MGQTMTKREDFEARALPQLENLYRAALHISGDEADAQDLVQETYIKAYHSWHESEADLNCRVRLFRIMASALDKKYRSSRIPASAINNPGMTDGYVTHSRLVNRFSIDNSVQTPLSSISAEDVREAIRNLPNNLKLIVVLSLSEGFSYQEIADITGINLEAVRSRLFQGRKLMLKNLLDHTARESEYAMVRRQKHE